MRFLSIVLWASLLLAIPAPAQEPTGYQQGIVTYAKMYKRTAWRYRIIRRNQCDVWSYSVESDRDLGLQKGQSVRFSRQTEHFYVSMDASDKELRIIDAGLCYADRAPCTEKNKDDCFKMIHGFR